MEGNDGAREQSRYKFMVNIYRKPHDGMRYVKMLEAITNSPYIKYKSLFTAVLVFIAVSIPFIATLTLSSSSLYYTGVWIVIGYIASLVLIVMFILPHRNKSLLGAVMGLLRFKLSRRTYHKRPVLSSVGIKSVETDYSGKTLVRFLDGKVGRMYKISGVIGLSTLPSVADSVARARANYFIERSHTTTEIMLTRVTRAQFSSQLINMKNQVDRINEGEFGDPDSMHNIWRKYMIGFNYSYIFDNMRNRDRIVEQFLILRENNEDLLLRAENALMRAASEGMYSNQPVELTEDEIERLIKEMFSTHRKFATAENELPNAAYDTIVRG